MDVRKRTIAIIAIVSLCLIVGLGLYTQAFILSEFVLLEEDILDQTIDRTVRIIDRERSFLSASVQDWAMWDDTYLYIQGLDPNYPSRNLHKAVFDYLNIDSIIITENDGTIAFGHGYDSLTEEYIPVPDSLYALHRSVLDTEREELSGLYQTEAGPMLVVIRPILMSSGEGPVMGTLLFARAVKEEWIEDLSSQTGVPVILTVFADEIYSPDISIQKDDHLITGSKVLTDLSGAPVFTLSVAMDRTIYAKGFLSVQSAFIVIAAFALVYGIVIYLLINQSLLKRITSLNREVRDITKNSHMNRSVIISGEDELTELAVSINSMLRAIHEDQQIIRENEERYRLLFNSTIDPMLLVAVDKDSKPGEILDANLSALSLLGLSYDNLIGIRLSKIFSIDRDMQGFDTQYVIGFFTPQHSNPVPVEVSMHSFVLKDMPAAIWVARDISERVQIEEERQASIEQISHNVEQFAILGDNIRNPLQVIRGYLSLFEDRTEYVEVIEDQIEQIDDRIRQLDEGWLESENVINFLRRNHK
ncbi:MAG: CHASE4 domain-containing protein [Methanocalculus sp.]|uniref:CHASE4 domain-containing protein n=1 Tax=Methanocalculus sp. TaxID=2004547 RepID=UPI00271926D3|nr:CHASE4 domain-containing protein [Methanocalculus sp.]MDO9538774.1 CHASE4 domain-containing protein [Methanocalculus sp.]